MMCDFTEILHLGVKYLVKYSVLPAITVWYLVLRAEETSSL
jgi:hypothetical protein